MTHLLLQKTQYKNYSTQMMYHVRFKEIIKQFELIVNILILSNVERPIRVLGKFNFDKGLQPEH